jgi:hypothetical protein
MTIFLSSFWLPDKYLNKIVPSLAVITFLAILIVGREYGRVVDKNFKGDVRFVNIITEIIITVIILYILLFR